MISEAEFQLQVTELAEMCGWSWVHFRPAQTSKGWRTPVSGPLGKGWPDLVLVRAKDRRLIFAELKAGRGSPATAEQSAVLSLLAATTLEVPTFQTVIWRPAAWDEIVATLR